MTAAPISNSRASVPSRRHLASVVRRKRASGNPIGRLSRDTPAARANRNAAHIMRKCRSNLSSNSFRWLNELGLECGAQIYACRLDSDARAGNLLSKQPRAGLREPDERAALVDLQPSALD